MISSNRLFNWENIADGIIAGGLLMYIKSVYDRLKPLSRKEQAGFVIASASGFVGSLYAVAVPAILVFAYLRGYSELIPLFVVVYGFTALSIMFSYDRGMTWLRPGSILGHTFLALRVSITAYFGSVCSQGLGLQPVHRLDRIRG